MFKIICFFFPIILFNCNLKSSSDNLEKSRNSQNIASTDLVQKENDYAVLKFESKKTFGDYPTNLLFKGKAKPLDFESKSESKHFKTVIKQTYQTGKVNFAGHYCFIYWGCGSPCKMSVLVDLISGKIYDGPTSALGYEFYNNSRMLVVNPVNHKEVDEVDEFHPKPEFYLDCPYCKPEVYIWDENKKVFIKNL